MDPVIKSVLGRAIETGLGPMMRRRWGSSVLEAVASAGLTLIYCYWLGTVIRFIVHHSFANLCMKTKTIQPWPATNQSRSPPWLPSLCHNLIQSLVKIRIEMVLVNEDIQALIYIKFIQNHNQGELDPTV